MVGLQDVFCCRQKWTRQSLHKTGDLTKGGEPDQHFGSIFQVVCHKDLLRQGEEERLRRGTCPALTSTISTPTLVTKLLRTFSPGKNVVRLP